MAESRKILTVDNNGGIGSILLTITFVVLKALGYIDWSWWIVFSPLWGGLALILVIGMLLGLFAGVMAIFKTTKKK